MIILEYMALGDMTKYLRNLAPMYVLFLNPDDKIFVM